MTYVEPGQVIHDADAHILETPDWFEPFADRRVSSALHRILDRYCAEEVEASRALHADPLYRERDESELMTRKNWRATGSFLSEDRPAALDLLGFASQLIFPTMSVGYLAALEHRDDMDLLYGTAEASNRAIRGARPGSACRSSRQDRNSTGKRGLCAAATSGVPCWPARRQCRSATWAFH